MRYDFYPDRLEVFHGDTPDDCTIFALRTYLESVPEWRRVENLFPNGRGW